MNILFDNDRSRAFVEKGLEATFDAEKSQSLGVVTAQGELIAGVVFHDYSAQYRRIELSAFAANPHWFTRSTATQILRYPFAQLQCFAVVVQTHLDNVRTRKLWRAIGAVETIVPDYYGEGRDACVCLLKKTDWYNSKYRKDHG